MPILGSTAGLEQHNPLRAGAVARQQQCQGAAGWSAPDYGDIEIIF
jgi:hypothetical protein